jgi:beta-phosphoglucomutase
MTDLKTLVKNKSAILFDMDGTLVNTEPLHAKASVKVLAELGVKVDLMACIDQFYGMTDHVVLKTVCPHLSDDEIDSAITEKNRHLVTLFKQLSHSEKQPYITPGLFDFLNYLKLEKKKCAVVSASEDIIVLETLACFGIDVYMDIQMGRNQTPLTKPHPDPYIEGMKRLNVNAAETVIFEDSPTGLKSAAGSLASVIRITAFAHSTSGQKIEGSFPEFKNFL